VALRLPRMWAKKPYLSHASVAFTLLMASVFWATFRRSVEVLHGYTEGQFDDLAGLPVPAQGGAANRVSTKSGFNFRAF